MSKSCESSEATQLFPGDKRFVLADQAEALSLMTWSQPEVKMNVFCLKSKRLSNMQFCHLGNEKTDKY